MDKKLLVLNWKINPATPKAALALAKASDISGMVVVPPFVYIQEVKKILKKAQLGAQDLFGSNDMQAATGEISGTELKNLGVTYVIVGHSERRHTLGETDAIVARKMQAASEIGLTPILCVGETKAEKDAGEREEVLKRQLETGLSLIFLRGKPPVEIIIAYEPVWAIGNGNPEEPASAAATMSFIKQFVIERYHVQPRMLYGGSVTSQNIADYLNYKEVDGALIGGASLKASEVKKCAALIK